MSQKSILDFLKKKKGAFLFSLVLSFLFLLSSFLFSLPRNYVFYMLLLTLVLLVLYTLISYFSWRKKEAELEGWLENKEYSNKRLPDFLQKNPLAYKIQELEQEKIQEWNKEEEKLQAQKEYYTIWAHQIKSPLFALRLLLKDPDFNLSQANQELFEMEEYVENILGYIRLESHMTDYVFSSSSLDDLIRVSIRKYSSLCIGQGNRMNFTETKTRILTDSKWFSFILDQILSNAIKYTKKGSISIYMEANRLCIEDTGIGIRSEDLPRIFDRGYTGYNGRLENKSTGLGLSLVQSIAKNLRISVSAESEAGKGTCISLDLNRILE